jgi:hypothetical protein
MRPDTNDRAMFTDANGCPAERVIIDGQSVIIHYDDVPESDITTVHGLRCTTPLRTVIDVATQLDSTELDDLLQQCLERELFSIDQLRARVAQPDLRDRRGAALVLAAIARRR